MDPEQKARTVLVTLAAERSAAEFLWSEKTI
jgi:hypothetical protein